ncbi:MFS transporter [Pseudohyphozyma bogoriensis]|nr:MFS transporter [Pseudohyphozyma bogoriensis]
MAVRFYLAVVYNILFGDLIAYSYIFAPYDLSPGMLGTVFLAIPVGLIFCGALAPLMLQDFRSAEKKRRKEGDGTVLPESMGVFYADVSIWATLGSQALFGFGILTTFISSYQYLIDPVAGGAVVFTGPMYERLGAHWALTLLACISLVMCAIPWVFYNIHGPTIRSWSKSTPNR